MKDRDFKRMALPIDVVYSIPTRGETWAPSKATNISLGGMEVLIKERLPIGTQLVFQITFPRRSRTTLASGELIWLKESAVPGKRLFDVGIRFIQADPFDFEALLESVGRLVSWQSNPERPARLP